MSNYHSRLSLRPGEVLSISPVVKNTEGQFITDTVGWTRINGSYIAQGTEGFAVIGNFESNDETTVIKETLEHLGNPIYLYVDDVTVRAFDPLPDTLLICDNEEITLQAEFPEAEIFWNEEFESRESVVVSEPGLYIAEARIHGCTLRDSVRIVRGDAVTSFAFPSDTLLCREDLPIILNPALPGDYFWEDGSTRSEYLVEEAGDYAVTVSNECGDFTFFSRIDTEDCGCDFFIPTAFSPNSDGINDCLVVFVGCDFEYDFQYFAIYDRWGNQIYTLTNPNEIAWNGRVNGDFLDDGVYVWILEYTVTKNDITQRRIQKGDTTVIK